MCKDIPIRVCFFLNHWLYALNLQHLLYLLGVNLIHVQNISEEQLYIWCLTLTQVVCLNLTKLRAAHPKSSHASVIVTHRDYFGRHWQILLSSYYAGVFFSVTILLLYGKYCCGPHMRLGWIVLGSYMCPLKFWNCSRSTFIISKY